MMLQQVETLLDCMVGPTIDLSPDYGYYPNASNMWLIVKDVNLEEATIMFEGTGVAITAEGKRHLGAAISTHDFVER